MPWRLDDKGRNYKRFRHSTVEKQQLAQKGLQHVLSSNVSAVGTDGQDLIIRFHNGSLYRYPNKGGLKNSILNSNSKGHWVWVYLRRPKVDYKKIGSIKLEGDLQLTDEQMMDNIDNSVLDKLTSVVSTQQNVIKSPAKTILGLNMNKTIIGGLILYTLI